MIAPRPEKIRLSNRTLGFQTAPIWPRITGSFPVVVLSAADRDDAITDTLGRNLQKNGRENASRITRPSRLLRPPGFSTRIHPRVSSYAFRASRTPRGLYARTLFVHYASTARAPRKPPALSRRWVVKTINRYYTVYAARFFRHNS